MLVRMNMMMSFQKKQDEYDALRKELIKIKKEIDLSSEVAPTDLKLDSIFNYFYLVANVDSVKRIIETLKEHIIERKVQYIEEVNESLNVVEKQVQCNRRKKSQFLKKSNQRNQ
ncbi:MAG: hypothetical protein L6U99_13520 [Clostridium sp.]|nr:MAG: hypothetical protein L6U99_13520 [Clostridium sp.]